MLLDHVPTARLLLVLTCQTGVSPTLGPPFLCDATHPDAPAAPQVEAMVLRVTGGKPLPAEVLRQIVAKTDGIPLFVEELVKTILEAGLVREEAGPLCADRPAATPGDSDHVAGCADGPAGPVGGR